MAAESPAVGAAVRIGAYADDVGSGTGSFAQFEGEFEHENASALAAALDEVPNTRPRPVAAIEEFQETADEVTGRIEKAENLLEAATHGQLFAVDNLTGELDSLLDLFGRLDRAGRFEEELRLMRSLNGLLALALRWLDLIRSLRSLLRSAQVAGHTAGQAFAHHELGTLHLCAGEAEQAREHLREATRLQERMGAPGGHCATRHNLDSAVRDLLESASGIQPPRRLQRLVVLGGAIAIAAATGAGIAYAVHDGRGQQSTASVPASQSQSITVTKQAPESAAYGSQFAVAATGGGSGNPITYSSSGACTNDGTAFTMTKASGTCSVDYHQAGNADYKPAPQVIETVTAAKGDQSINVTAPAPTVAVFNSKFTVAARDAGSGKPIVYSSSGACSNSGATFTMTSGSGTCSVEYTQAGNSRYKAAQPVTEKVTAAKAEQSIRVTTPAPALAILDSRFTVAATGSGSGEPVAYSSSGGTCSNSGAAFTMNSATGTCSVTFALAGDNNYKPASPVTEKVYGGAAFGGFQLPSTSTPLPNKAGSPITVRFKLTDALGKPLDAPTATSLAAAGDLRAGLTGPGLGTTQPPPALCSWLGKGSFFQCVLKTPAGVTSGTGYSVTAAQNVGGVFVPVPPYTNAYANPETISFQ